MIRRKRGTVGWPGPQTRQILAWCKTYQCAAAARQAQTGTRYLTITSYDGDAQITVRVADHADCYATADYTVDPVEDQRQAVRGWIIDHGHRRSRRMTARMVRQWALDQAAIPGVDTHVVIQEDLDGNPRVHIVDREDHVLQSRHTGDIA